MNYFDSSHVWHVAKTGNDGNSGHAGQYPVNLANDAKLTIGAAITAASAGDTIVIWPGAYSENVSVSKALNLIGMHPTLCKANSFTFTAPGCYGYQLSVDGSGSSAIQLSGSDDTTLERCNAITTGGDGFYFTSNPERVRLIECYGKSGYDGIQAGNCIDTFLYRCLFESTGAAVGAVKARALTTTGSCSGLLVKDCIMRVNNAAAIDSIGANIEGQATLINCSCEVAFTGTRTQSLNVAGIKVSGEAVVLGANIVVSGGAPNKGLWTDGGMIYSDNISFNPETSTEYSEAVTAQVEGHEKCRFVAGDGILQYLPDDQVNNYYVTWTSGSNAGEGAYVDDFVAADDEVRVDAGDAFTNDIEVGDEFVLALKNYGAYQESTGVISLGKAAFNGGEVEGEIGYLVPIADDNGRVDVGLINGDVGAVTSLVRSAAVRGNKAVQDKASGTISVRNYDDSSDLLVMSLSDDGTAITREITEA